MTNGMLKWPLLIAAGLVVARVISEQLGAPESINFVFGVVWLYFIVPFYFVSAIVKNGSTRPYLELLGNLFAFSLTTRLMVLPTYWLAYAFQWPAVRFRLDAGGVVGEGVTALQGYLIYPSAERPLLDPLCCDCRNDLGQRRALCPASENGPSGRRRGAHFICLVW